MKNETKSVIGYEQERSNSRSSEAEKLLPMKEVAYTWNDYEESKRRINLLIGGKKQSYSLDKYKKLKDIITKEDIYMVELIDKEFTKILRVRSKRLQDSNYYSEEIGGNSLIQQLSIKSPADNFMVMFKMKGIGISLVTEDPKELLYISINNMQIKLSRNSIEGNLKQTDTEFKIRIGHIQIDNMLDKSFPTIFLPKKLFFQSQEDYNGDEEQNAEDLDQTPFVQISIYIYNIYIYIYRFA